MLSGPSLEQYKKLLSIFPELKLIASGGISSVQDLQELQAVGCQSAIVGKAIYEGNISLNELAELC
jgi:phosphoribosylformimino-5-aminoimidazole carboxamide ribotide isomerase